MADMVTALMFGNPLSLIKSLLLNNGVGFTIVFSVFLVFAKKLLLLMIMKVHFLYSNSIFLLRCCLLLTMRMIMC